MPTIADLEERISAQDKEIEELKRLFSESGHGAVVNHGKRLEVDMSCRISDLVNVNTITQEQITSVSYWDKNVVAGTIFPREDETVTIKNIPHEADDFYKYLVASADPDEGEIRYRTGAELIADIGYWGRSSGVLSPNVVTDALLILATVTIGTISWESTDVDKFLVSNSGLIKYRTGAQVYEDIDGPWERETTELTPRNDGDDIRTTGLITGKIVKYRGDGQVVKAFQHSMATKEYVQSRDDNTVLSGLLTQVDNFDDGGNLYQVWGDGKFIYLANTSLGLRSYKIENDGTLTYIDNYARSTMYCVWGDGKYIYVGGAFSVGDIYTIEVDANGNLSATEFWSGTTGSILCIWGDGRFIYAGTGSQGWHIFTVDADGDLHEVNDHFTSNSCEQFWGDGTFLFLANGPDGVNVYTIGDDGNETLVGNDDQGDVAKGVWGDGTFLYVTYNSLGVAVYTYDADGSLTHLANYTTGVHDEANKIWGDGKFLYVANNDGETLVYSVSDAGVLSLITTVDEGVGNDTVGVWGDGKFIYVSTLFGGVYVYSVDYAYEYDKANFEHLFNGFIELQQPVYEDIQVSISNIRIPAANAPTQRLYNHGIGAGVTFPVLGFAVGDYIYFDIQTTHGMKLNTILNNHIHFILPNTTNIGDKWKFQLDVIAAALDVAFAVPAGSPFTAEHTIVANDNTHHRLLGLADIPAANSTVSTLYSCVLKRIAASANEYGSEVYLKFNDSHYQKNTMGSRTEGAK